MNTLLMIWPGLGQGWTYRGAKNAHFTKRGPGRIHQQGKRK